MKGIMIADAPTQTTRTVTLTLDVPADLAERLHALPADIINRFTLAALPAVVEAAEEAGDSDHSDPDDFPAELLLKHPLPTSLTESFAETARKVNADIEAGRVIDGETFLANIRRRAGRTA